eukprot:Skav215693  [mRNA]  locus=scaffold5690:16896:30299:- [translate_table: standard]
MVSVLAKSFDFTCSHAAGAWWIPDPTTAKSFFGQGANAHGSYTRWAEQTWKEMSRSGAESGCQLLEVFLCTACACSRLRLKFLLAREKQWLRGLLVLWTMEGERRPTLLESERRPLDRHPIVKVQGSKKTCSAEVAEDEADSAWQAGHDAWDGDEAADEWWYWYDMEECAINQASFDEGCPTYDETAADDDWGWWDMEECAINQASFDEACSLWRSA